MMGLMGPWVAPSAEYSGHTMKGTQRGRLHGGRGKATGGDEHHGDGHREPERDRLLGLGRLHLNLCCLIECHYLNSPCEVRPAGLERFQCPGQRERRNRAVMAAASRRETF